MSSYSSLQRHILRVRQAGCFSCVGKFPLSFRNSLPRKPFFSLEGVVRVVNQIEVVEHSRQWRLKMDQQEMERQDDSLRKAAEGGNVAAKYRYALQCSDPEEKRRWLKKAADAGYIPAMCDYGLECEDHEERKHWLREAAYEGHIPAIYRYALECNSPMSENAGCDKLPMLGTSRPCTPTPKSVRCSGNRILAAEDRLRRPCSGDVRLRDVL